MKTSLKASLVAVMGVLGVAAYSGDDVDGWHVQSEEIRQERIARSPQFDNGTAISRLPQVDHSEGMLSVMWKFFMARDQYKPHDRLTFKAVDTAKLVEPSQDLRVTWLGHSSLFVEADGVRMLIDPVFDYASPSLFSRWFSRNVDAPVSREALPLPDVILISHDHYDHLEESTARYYADKNVTFYVPLGVGRHLEKWGVNPANIHEFDWWESQRVGSVRITSAPANHTSGRGLFDKNQTLWTSWAIQANAGSVFYSGDSAYGEHFKAIGEKLGPFDLTFLEVAANLKADSGYPVEGWGHMQAAHTMQAHLDVRGDKLFPVHWSTYELFLNKWDEPVNDLIDEAASYQVELVTPMIGESLDLSQPIRTAYWWQSRESWYDLSKLAMAANK
ncbi:MULTISPECIES: MBL fold metallo-hydrolase [Photobacterium]|uniref:Beta-lactamase n=1 Tax=Photobacterium ganghwense TaxID=320778 RepID=A0A0J1HDZ6_9GAMM|nr:MULTISPECIES: MBL fold metallo-hydrolase [Photobacterium]KLV09846.1 beta-lactamase [Photobacterium ganghwense]MBV1839589.1 MBL fold metallo-hydrolase [Photobacterium ganghwense]PSU09313.1 MBL fold metallo-hydrolase [Photobacterium ganghwense]QSV16500.1 MBL fold metallo-hydrolase [Photobacterium ganghwense]